MLNFYHNNKKLSIILSLMIEFIPYTIMLLCKKTVLSIVWILICFFIQITILNLYAFCFKTIKEKEDEFKIVYVDNNIGFGSVLKVKYLTDSSGHKENIVLLVSTNQFDKTGAYKVIDLNYSELICSFNSLKEFKDKVTIIEYLGRIEIQ